MDEERQTVLSNFINSCKYTGLIGVGNNTLSTSRFEYSDEMLKMARENGYGYVLPLEPNEEEKNQMIKIICERDGRSESEVKDEIEYYFKSNASNTLFYDKTGELSQEMCNEIIAQFYKNYDFTSLNGLFGISNEGISIPNHIVHYEELISVLKEAGFNIELTQTGAQVICQRHMSL